jgi:branched-chain amino acid transport system ATP-binding protein
VIRLSSGRVLIGGRDVTGLPPEEVARAGVGYVPQVDDVFAPLTVGETWRWSATCWRDAR